VKANGSKYAPVPGKIPGAALNLGGIDFIAAPLNLDSVQAAMALLDRLKGVDKTEDALRGAAEVILLSLQRNNPDLTLDQLMPLIDLGNWEGALSAVCGASGIMFAKPGEPRPAGP